VLFRKFDPESGKVLKHTKTLLFGAAEGYVRPTETGSFWWITTTSVWNIDEIIGRRIRDWRRLTQESGHQGSRAGTFKTDHESIFTGLHSVFPSPLMEWIILRYGGPPGGLILDAFAGGPPRGVVSALMGYRYLGYDIRQEQINEDLKIIANLGVRGSVDYKCSDGTVLDGCEDNSCDAAISCPPYYNLEQYSDLPNDLSNLNSYDEFNQAMFNCAKAHFRVMKPGTFVCMVVGNFRTKDGDRKGELIDFRSDTVFNFREAGFVLQQDVVLVKNFASAAIRAPTAWLGKKLVSRHEYLLVFRKPEEVKRKRLKLEVSND
jgi:DNA modification methylase